MGLDQTQPPFFPYPDLAWGNEVITVTRNRPWCPDCGPLSLNEVGQIIAHHCPTYSNLPSIDGFQHAQEHTPVSVPDEAFLRNWAANIADDAKEPSQDA